MDTHQTTPQTHEAARQLGRTMVFKTAADRDTTAFHALAALCRTEVFETGQDIVREGDIGDHMFILKSGTVEVRKRTLHGSPFTVTQLSPGQNGFFGELGLIDRDIRSATVTALTRCALYVIDRHQFLELGERYPRLALTVTREISLILCHRLRKADQDIITLFSALVEEVAESGGVIDPEGEDS